ncbi:hypothetical protein B0T21DRAFT_283710, partial [Apiosordaria backusii]
LIIVNKFTKFAFYITIISKFIVLNFIDLFLNYIYCLYSLLKYITLNKGLLFTSNF